ncbi:hypothetical protein TNCV_2393391 [Trichonephila clavipes]|nr:hypothetical protein TNCV_2393391 [Trichonephila clavipes]
MTSVPGVVPSPCAGSEAARVRTGQWSSPIVKKTASVFATLRAIFHLENQSSKSRSRVNQADRKGRMSPEKTGLFSVRSSQFTSLCPQAGSS